MVLLGVHEVVAVVSDFSSRLEANRSALNKLNVFPVADNDTGSNMAHTLVSICSALDGVMLIEAAAHEVETAALDGRGNSGLIIGQFLAGFFSTFEGDQIDLARGLDEGARWARQAVTTPVEGTMLTVADVAAAHAATASLADGVLSLDSLAAAVVVAVDATPGQLAVLAERGVVDSGAAGLLLFFEALRSVVGGSVGPGPDDSVLISCDVGLGSNQPGPAELADVYEIQFRVPTSLVTIDELRLLLVSLGTDVVIGSSAKELAAHVHVADPHRATVAISAAIEHRPGAKAISYDVEAIIETDQLA